MDQRLAQKHIGMEAWNIIVVQDKLSSTLISFNPLLLFFLVLPTLGILRDAFKILLTRKQSFYSQYWFYMIFHNIQLFIYNKYVQYYI